MNAKKTENTHNGWLGYRPKLKILDCTIRDGGLINDHKFSDDMVKNVYETLLSAGIDYIEFGYKASKRIYTPDKFGAWKYCGEDEMRRVIGDKTGSVRISVMADAERTDYHTDILPKDESVIDCIRVACYIHQIPTALDMIADAHEKGYETLLQLMAVSVVNERDLREALAMVAETPVTAVYIVDSFGSLYTEQVRNLTALYIDALKGTGKDVGFHGHNNQQLAYANTIEALIAGANRVDATISGIGRGAGNCPLELLIGFLHNPKFHLRPVLKCCRDVFAPLAKEIDWGYSITYAITGQLNQHPREAIKWRSDKNPDDFVAFYDQIIEEE